MSRQLSRPLTRSIERAARQLEARTRRWPATLGDATGVVDVPGRPGFVYVLMPDGTSAVAYNIVTPHTPTLPVWVGYRPWNPAFLTVLDFVAAYRDVSPTTGMGPHHLTHEWLAAAGGNDVVFSAARQLTPLRVSVVSGLVIRVEAGAVWTPSGWVAAPTGTLDLTALVPATGTCYVLVFLDAAGLLDARAGAPAAIFGTLAYTDIPAAVAGELPLAAIALAVGQTTITETQTQADVVDLRFVTRPVPADPTLTFLALTDTPAAYTGAAGSVPVVNAGETALEFVAGVDIGDDAALVDSVNFLERGTDPATPAAGHWRLFTKAGGVYAIDDAGAVVGPFADGVSAFLALSDTPGSYSGEALKGVRVNAGATALEFYTPTAIGQYRQFLYILAGAGSATVARSFFVVPVFTEGALSFNGASLADGVTDIATGHFVVPADFSADLIVTPIFLPADAVVGTVVRYSENAFYGADGESFSTHTASVTERDGTVSNDALTQTALEPMTLSDAAIGDVVELWFTRAGGHANDTLGSAGYLRGWIVTYAASVSTPGDFMFLTDDDGHPLMGLMDLE